MRSRCNLFLYNRHNIHWAYLPTIPCQTSPFHGLWKSDALIQTGNVSKCSKIHVVLKIFCYIIRLTPFFPCSYTISYIVYDSSFLLSSDNILSWADGGRWRNAQLLMIFQLLGLPIDSCRIIFCHHFLFLGGTMVELFVNGLSSSECCLLQTHLQMDPKRII